MSWLFGRRNEDDEEYSDEYTDESHSHSSEGDDHDEEDDGDEDDEKSEELNESFEKSKQDGPRENGQPPPEEPTVEDPKEDPKEDEEDVTKVNKNPLEETNDDNPKEKESTSTEPEEEHVVDDTAKIEETLEETVEKKPSAPEPTTTVEKLTTTQEEIEPKLVEAEDESETVEQAGESTSENYKPKLIENNEAVEQSEAEHVPNDASKEEDVKEEDQVNEQESTKGKEEEEDETEEVTSTHEKRSLLVLAAEHDRVDILNAILADDSEDRDALLNSSIPPLHISIAYGSTNAVQCLLRMGADPSVRPDIKKIKEDADAGGEEQLVDIPNMGRFDQLSAWELAFGKADEVQEPKKSGGWFGGGDKRSNSIDIAPSKLEGIRHAFTAEGLRCIGSDEVHRLKELIDSGMPATIDIGGKNLYDWAVELGALQCEELLRPAEADRNSEEANKDKSEDQQPGQSSTGSESASSAVLDRSKPGTESLSQLANRIDELKSLSEALSGCLDNLAEEVSVCHGLLLMGGGASALASHVKSLKTFKDNKVAELERLEEAWENSEDELAYWVKEAGETGREIAELMTPAIISSVEGDRPAFDGSPDEEQGHRQQLKQEAALLENKIRKLRASITDLSEESTRDLEEVEKRGLSGGIKLVRSLRDEIREVEFALNETKSAEALCRAKIKLIQSKMGHGKKQSASAKAEAQAVVGTAGRSSGESREAVVVETVTSPMKPSSSASSSASPLDGHGKKTSRGLSEVEASNYTARIAAEPKPSEKIASGQSNAIALKDRSSHGYFTVELWRVLLRILGLRSSRPVSSQGSANVMIV